MMVLAEHRAKAAHLPHEPLLDLRCAFGVVTRIEKSAFAGKMKQVRTRFKQRQRFAARHVMIDNSRDPFVGAIWGKYCTTCSRFHILTNFSFLCRPLTLRLLTHFYTLTFEVRRVSAVIFRYFYTPFFT